MQNYGSTEAIYLAHSPLINDSKDPPHKKKAIHQSATYQAVMAPLLQDATTRIHQKLARWRLHDHTKHHSTSPNVRENTPAWQADRTTKLLAKLAHLAAPRVGSAVFNTVGDHSVVVGGQSNVAAGDHSIVVGGESNRASGAFSFVGGGGNPTLASGNHCHGNYSAIVGGKNNLIHSPYGYNSFIGGGQNNTCGQADFSGGNNSVR